MWFPGAREGRNGEMVFKWYRVSVCKMRNFGSWWHKTNVTILNMTELYTQKWLRY